MKETTMKETTMKETTMKESALQINIDGEITNISNLPQKKQKKILLGELISLHNTILNYVQSIDDASKKQRLLKERIAASQESIAVKKLNKEIADAKAHRSAALAYRSGILKAAKILNLEVTEELENMKKLIFASEEVERNTHNALNRHES